VVLVEGRRRPSHNQISKVKRSLRSAGALTLQSLQKALKTALQEITDSDIKGWFQHCGYCIEPN
jgi:hypothetical protein